MEEGFTQFTGQQRLRQISEELFHHIGHVVRRLVLVVNIVRRTFIHLSEGLDARLHTRLAKKTHLGITIFFIEVE